MGKHSIAQGDGPCKDIFTASELAEMARFDAALEAEEIFLTKEERALSAALDREAMAEAEERIAKSASGLPAMKKATAEHRAATSKKARTKAWQDGNREKMLAYYAKYNAAHRQERRDYQRAYDAAHRAEISAKRKARRAEKRKEKEHGQ